MIFEISQFWGTVLTVVVYGTLVAALLLLAVSMVQYAYQIAHDQFVTRSDWRCLAWCYWTLVKGKDGDKVLRYHDALERHRIKSHASLPDADRGAAT